MNKSQIERLIADGLWLAKRKLSGMTVVEQDGVLIAHIPVAELAFEDVATRVMPYMASTLAVLKSTRIAIPLVEDCDEEVKFMFGIGVLCCTPSEAAVRIAKSRLQYEGAMGSLRYVHVPTAEPGKLGVSLAYAQEQDRILFAVIQHTPQFDRKAARKRAAEAYQANLFTACKGTCERGAQFKVQLQTIVSELSSDPVEYPAALYGQLLEKLAASSAA